MSPKEAARALIEEFHIGDYIYRVRERAIEEDPGFSGNSWHHPKVTRFNEICKTLRAFAEEESA